MPPPGTEVVDLADQMRQSAIKRSSRIEITEDSLNACIAARLGSSVDPRLAEWAQFDRLSIRLTDGMAQAVMEWDVMGHVHTISVNLSVERVDEEFEVRVLEGAFGQLQVIRGLLRPMAPTFRRLGDVFGPEIRSLFRMNQIEIKEGKLVLDPRF
jgi:hypothetical protein